MRPTSTKPRRRLAAFLLAGLAALLVLGGPAAAADKLKIVCTTTDLAAITKAVAGDLAQVSAITTGKEDPHFIQAKPSYIVQARDADLWIRVGMELEVGWEEPLIDGARNSRIRVGSPGHLDASQRVLRLEVPTQKVTRAMGDVHPQGNPHWWLDPLNGRVAAGDIAKRLMELDPAHAEQYKHNLHSFQHILDDAMFGPMLSHQIGGPQLWAWQLKGVLGQRLAEMGADQYAGGWWGAMRPFHGQSLVTYHKSWIYFCNRFGLKVAAELEPKPGVPPSGAHLKEVEQIIKARKVRLILQEPFYPTKAGEMVAQATATKLVVVTNSVGGEPDARDYLSLISLIVSKVSGALR